MHDDELIQFEAEGIDLPEGGAAAAVENDGARIWYASFGVGRPVILLHGGLGHSANFGKQVPALVAAGYRAITVDSRGHGRSTRDKHPYTYQLMASDVRAVMDALGLKSAALVGWSDGAATALVLAHDTPARSDGVFYFACNMDDSGTWPFEMTPVIGRCYNRHVKDYAALSPTPDQFEAFAAAVQTMQSSQPNYSAADLASIRTPVVIVQGDGEEFIRREHAEYLARTIPGAAFVLLPGVSHFAPVQRPEVFNAAVLEFLAGL
jgi:pimeloyl-ACP methyl ester carboxylesterase